MSFLDRIAACNNAADNHVPLWLGAERVGAVRKDRLAVLGTVGAGVFEVGDAAVHFDPALRSPTARSDAIDHVVQQLMQDGTIQAWRGERYPCLTAWGEPPLFDLERAAVPWFGITAYGVHVNGFVRRTGGAIDMWIARRSRQKPTYPGMLDNMVAGGQPVGFSLMENVVKECDEEAGVPASLAASARPVGAVTYCYENRAGLKPDCMFCFDLELPADFTPSPQDGEVEAFELWPLGQVADAVANSTAFKFNCNLVVIDFLLRHGQVAADRPDYLALARGLHAW